jgi:hypothetical protein
MGSVIVNGSISNPFNKYSGLMQGGLWSPVLFSFYIDDMSKPFQNDVNQFTIPLKLFADDIAIVRTGKEITPQLQQDISCVEQWCNENSMKINAKKSAILDSARIQLGDKPGLLSDGSQMPVVSTYKYLGFPFTKQGIDLTALINIGIQKGEEALVRARLKGSTWPQWMRYHIFKSFIKSRWEYGAPLIFQALISNPTKKLQKAFETLETLEEDCFRWILGGKPGSRVDSQARGLLGTSALRNRFRDLHILFVDHLKDISGAGTELKVVLEKVKAEFIPILPSLVSRLFRNKLYQSYQQKANSYKNNPANWIINGVTAKSWEDYEYPENPPSLKVHLRLVQQVEDRKSYVMLSLIRDRCRTAKGLGLDTSLLIPLSAIRAYAIQWRLNNFGHRLQCPAHESPFTRSCIHSCHLVDNCTEISLSQWNRYEQSQATYLTNPRGKLASCYTILDDLLNFNEWRTFAFVLLFLIRKIHQARKHSISAKSIDKIEVDLEELLSEFIISPLAIPTSSSSELLTLDNG